MNRHGARHDARAPLTASLASAALAGFIVNAGYGTAVAAGLFGTARMRWVHHALFILTSTLTGMTLLASLVKRRGMGCALVPAAAALIAMPSTRGGSPRHIALAASAFPSFLITALLARR